MPSSLLSLVSNAVILIRSDMFKAFIYTSEEYFCQIYSVVYNCRTFYGKARDFPHKKSLVKPVDHYSKLRKRNSFCGHSSNVMHTTALYEKCCDKICLIYALFTLASP